MTPLKFTSLSLLPTATIIAVGYFFLQKSGGRKANKSLPVQVKAKVVNNVFQSRLKEKAAELHDYAKTEHCNTAVCFLIDMKIPSGKNRFFIYNLVKDSIEVSGLVTHGSGSERVSEIYFSNEPGSNCTSLGKYKTGKPYYGKFGLAYKLSGLDKTNSHAFDRFVVLHSHSCVPDEEIYPLSICENWGCPTVAPTFLEKLKNIINASEKPIVLKIFY